VVKRSPNFTQFQLVLMVLHSHCLSTCYGFWVIWQPVGLR